MSNQTTRLVLVVALFALASCSSGDQTLAVTERVQGPAFCRHLALIGELIGHTRAQAVGQLSNLINRLTDDAVASEAHGQQSRADAIRYLVSTMRDFQTGLTNRNDAGAVEVFAKGSSLDQPGLNASGQQQLEELLTRMPEVESVSYHPYVFIVKLRLLMSFAQIIKRIGAVPGVGQVGPYLEGTPEPGQTLTSGSEQQVRERLRPIIGVCRFDPPLQFPFVYGP